MISDATKAHLRVRIQETEDLAFLDAHDGKLSRFWFQRITALCTVLTKVLAGTGVTVW